MNIRKKDSHVAKQKYLVVASKCGIRLNSVIGYNGKHAMVNMAWNPDCEFFAYTLGSIICCENLKTGKQTLLYSHNDDVTVLALRNDLTQMASASASYHSLTATDNSNSQQCQIIIWNCDKLDITATIYHKNAANIRAMSYSTDDRFLLTMSDCSSASNLVVWKTIDYVQLVCVSSTYNVFDVVWNPLKCNELAVCGKNKLLAVCHLDERPLGNASLQFNELEVPLIVREV